jgi:hypothetical protein
MDTTLPCVHLDPLGSADPSKDDLTERVVPDPPMPEADEEWDRYDYWQDIEYDTDGYGDDDRLIPGGSKRAPSSQKSKRVKQNNVTITTRSRKRKASDTLAKQATKRSMKRRKFQEEASTVILPVELLPTEELRPPERLDESIGDITKLKKVALPGWRDYVSNADEAEIRVDLGRNASNESLTSGSSQETFNGEDDEEEGPINPEFLQMALLKNLQNLGLDISSVDQDELLQLAERMMSNGAEADDLLANFVEGLMGEEEEDEKAEGEVEEQANGTFGKWVSDRANASASKRKDSLTEQAEKPRELEEPVDNTEPRALRGSKRSQELETFTPSKKRATRRGSSEA